MSLPAQPPTLLSHRRKNIRSCIRHFTWSWHTIVMGTGSIGSLLAHFHFHQPGSRALEIATLIFFFLDLLFFVLVCGATIARYYMFPELWPAVLRHPTQSLFIGTFPIGAATLISNALAVHQSYGFAGSGFVYALWVLWWVDTVVCFLTTVGTLVVTKETYSLDSISPTWLIPTATLVVGSSTGSLLATALIPVNVRYAAVGAATSFAMLLMGLPLCFMVITLYLMRLIVHGPLDLNLILSSFIVLGPLGQGGYSILINSQNVAALRLVPSLSPEAIQAVCFCLAWALWSMSFIWLCIALASVYSVVRHRRLLFSLAYWGLIFPNGVFALFTVELGVFLDNAALNYLGAVFSVLVFLLWAFVFAKTIPNVWDTTLFDSPCATKLDEGEF
ncbi:voltage-dependent anion channel [Roridomyces roridus]|uniref:Voltage-dependent anion channel n=1 Tax=Roridomyces roridus TaxID=1738132 RepID=A0AAD7G2R8_9AGAR|nr:voltage-dependent anion channel [Roridomyces roridus]